ncbi:3'-5' exonuclease [Neptuniibacter halophilus]|uniref:3'-5' exonuclease n=1 Tax=Neptuniibacter halophilus TaxID=651666 RepID=UPI0025735779|nr:3'-5' exonuclease [Neptuniibacter halophilus]
MPESNMRAPDDWNLFFREQALSVADPRLQLFYANGVIAADTPLAEVPFVALDFETTGLDFARDEIVSIGLVPFDLQRIRLREARHWLLTPRKALAEDSVVIHGITHSDIAGAPDLSERLAPLLEALAGRVAVVHYHTLERTFLNAALQRRVGEGICFPLVDTMEIEARQHRQGFSAGLRRFFGRKPASIRLADSRSRYHLPQYPLHDALADALATAELLQAQIRYHFSADTPISELWL